MQPVEYRKMAEVEDSMWYYRALHRHVCRSLDAPGLHARAAVLDAGCGTGGLLRVLSQLHPDWHLTGLDFSALACDFARDRTGAAIVQGSVLALPFPDAAFNAIVSCDVVCQVDDAQAALNEFWRCLKPGGRLVLTMPAYPWMYSYHDRQTGNLRRYTRQSLGTLLQGAGFEAERDTYWNMLPFPLAVVRRKFLPPRVATTSDVHLYSAPMEAAFNSLMEVEHTWMEQGGRLPFGSSVLMVGRKPLP